MIDLRSDTVTRPTPEMRKLMASAEVGDDVWGDDPTVNALEALSAEMLGKEAAMFVSSGTQSNLIGLMCHCQRGDEYLVGQHAHTYKLEGGGAAVLGSIQPQPIAVEADGTLSLDNILAVIKPDDFHYAKTRLLCLENTISGKVLPMEYLKQASDLADKHGLKKHLDGARIFNASVKLGIDVKEISAYFDSVSVCLSKGLGAPVGSVLCGSKELIKEARRWRKMLGGGMRQAGILAAAGIYVLENNIERLADDHANASLLGNELAKIPALKIDQQYLHTNMVFFSVPNDIGPKLAEHLKRQNILVDGRSNFRLVTHLDVSKADILTTVRAIYNFFA